MSKGTEKTAMVWTFGKRKNRTTGFPNLTLARARLGNPFVLFFLLSKCAPDHSSLVHCL
jgi:hypothetical protein